MLVFSAENLLNNCTKIIAKHIAGFGVETGEFVQALAQVLLQYYLK